MITKSIKITESQEKYLLDNHKNVNQGIQNCINNAMFPGLDIEILKYIRNYSRKELKGKFTKEEWYFFFDSLNGSIIDAIFRCNVGALAAHCEDAEAFEGAAKRYNVDITELIEKCKTLTGAQVDALYTFVEEFWNDENRDLEKYSKELS
jgi:hypothetical protein